MTGRRRLVTPCLAYSRLAGGPPATGEGRYVVVRMVIVENLPPDADGLMVADGDVTVVLIPARCGPDWIDRVARILVALFARLHSCLAAA